MDEKEQDEIFLFDTLYTTNHLQILKILFPLLPEEARSKVAIYIKWKELQYALEYEKHHMKLELNEKFTSPQKPDLEKLHQKLVPYCAPRERELLHQLLNMQNSMEKYKEIMNLMPLLESLTADSSGSSDMNLDSILKNMLSEEQQAMFAMFQGGMSDE